MTREEIFRRALDGIPDYERGFIDGMQEQMRCSVDKAVNALAKRKPLTDEEIESCIDEDFEYGLDRGNISNTSVIRFARAIELAHGIGSEE